MNPTADTLMDIIQKMRRVLGTFELAFGDYLTENRYDELDTQQSLQVAIVAWRALLDTIETDLTRRMN